jgi:hypothetical protein
MTLHVELFEKSLGEEVSLNSRDEVIFINESLDTSKLIGEPQ